MTKKNTIITVGLAIFTMLFGAGNVVFPLSLGRDLGDKVFYGILGFIITAVIVPLLGLITVMLFEGNYKNLLSTIGNIPAAIVTLICMILIGPFGAISRCLVISYAAVHWHLPQISLFVYSIFAVILVFWITQNKHKIIDLLGKFLGPVKLILLSSIIIIGLITPHMLEPTPFTPLQGFMRGFKEGFFTMDLLATIFFSTLIYSALKKYLTETEDFSTKHIITNGLKSGLIGGGLLGIIYVGFCLIAAIYGPHLHGISKEQILSAITTFLIGPKAGILANVTVAITCLTTAIALTAVFADYLTHDLIGQRISYLYALLITTVLTFAMTNIGFHGIMSFIEPIIVVFYPALVVLCIVNIANKVVGFRYIKSTVFSTLFGSLLFYHGHLFIKLISR